MENKNEIEKIVNHIKDGLKNAGVFAPVNVHICADITGHLSPVVNINFKMTVNKPKK